MPAQCVHCVAPPVPSYSDSQAACSAGTGAQFVGGPCAHKAASWRVVVGGVSEVEARRWQREKRGAAAICSAAAAMSTCDARRDRAKHVRTTGWLLRRTVLNRGGWAQAEGGGAPVRVAHSARERAYLPAEADT